MSNAPPHHPSGFPPSSYPASHAPPPSSYPPPHPSHAQAQQPYTNGYDYHDLSQQSSTATTPYSSGANSPAFAPHPSAGFPPQMAPSGSPGPPRKIDRIDPRQIPRPSDPKGTVIKYYTRSGAAPPSSTADFIAIDEGNCSPRFVRLTTNHIAHEQELIDTTKLCQ